MKVSVLMFGKFRDIVGQDTIVINDVADTDHLMDVIRKKYPEMSGNKCLIAVDKAVVPGKTILTDNSTVALMPPFSGG